MRETTVPFVWRKVPLIWVWVQQDLKAAGLDPQPKEGLVTAWALGGGEAHIALPSCLVPCSGCSPCTWACSQCISQQRGLTVQFFYARAGKNVGAKDWSPVSWMALLTRFGIHFRKEWIFCNFYSFPIRLHLKKSARIWVPKSKALSCRESSPEEKRKQILVVCPGKKKANSGGYQAVHHAPGPPSLAERPSDYFHYYCPSSR